MVQLEGREEEAPVLVPLADLGTFQPQQFQDKVIQVVLALRLSVQMVVVVVELVAAEHHKHLEAAAGLEELFQNFHLLWSVKQYQHQFSQIGNH
jgi:hypothetical protein